MKKFTIGWETDYCEDFPERNGWCIVEAETEDEAVKKFFELNIQKAVIIDLF